MKNSAINWTTHTANFWSGCFKVSDGCKNCYAETLSKRWGKDIWGPAATTPRIRGKAIWKDILKWDREAKQAGKRERVFVSSMSDFLEDHPMVAEWREEAIQIIERLEWLDVLMLTKRPENSRKFLHKWHQVYGWPAHVWFGTSIENQTAVEKRIPHLYRHPAKVRFLSVEPLLEKTSLYFGTSYVDWVIVGGESGPKARPFEWDWARSIRDECRFANVAFWMKQGGGFRPVHELADLPEDLRIRELPS